jgi:hypothetical protein
MPGKAGKITARKQMKASLPKVGKRKKAKSKIKATRMKAELREQPPHESTLAKLLAVSHPLTGDSQRQPTTEQVVFVGQPAGLEQIKLDAVQLAIWRRAKAPDFVKSLSDPSIAAAGLPNFYCEVTLDAVAQNMKEKLLSQKKRALTDNSIDELVTDVAQLVHIFAKISKSKTVIVRLEVLDDDGCAFWHQDCVPFRLVATYRGPCTEWVHPDFSKATLRRRQFDSKHSQTLSHHDVALFKGRGETPEESSLLGHPGIVHRSPRINGSGVHRVVLVLDIPATWHSE